MTDKGIVSQWYMKSFSLRVFKLDIANYQLLQLLKKPLQNTPPLLQLKIPLVNGQIDSKDKKNYLDILWIIYQMFSQ